MNVLFRLYFWIFSNHIMQRISRDPLGNWGLIERVFASANAVYYGPTGYSGYSTLEGSVVQQLASAQCKELECLLLENINHHNAMVAAYCIEALVLRNSPFIHRMPDLVFSRSEEIKKISACIGIYVTLGEFARMAVNRVAPSK